MTITQQILWLFILALPVACIAWTVTHEEIFHEWQEFCRERARDCKTAAARKFFYPFQCEFCFSHYVTIVLLAVTRFKLLFDDWRGYVLAGFSIVWIANQYMSAFARLRLDIRRERVEIKGVEHEVEEKTGEPVSEEKRAA